jgi:c-di-GMP-binding flagellar brake protein YcgR
VSNKGLQPRPHRTDNATAIVAANMKQQDEIHIRPQGGDNQLEDDSRFAVSQPAEIVFVLKKIMQNTQLVTAYLEDGADFALTSLLAVMPDTAEVVLDAPRDAAANKRLVAAKKVLLVTSHDQVKVKFATNDIREVRYKGRPALRIPLPGSLMRIQRREHYRIATPLTKPLICTLPMPGRGPGTQAETILLDISIGGVALMDNHDATGFQIGDVFENCRIGLPEFGTLVVSLEVRTSCDTPLKNGLSFRRCGCQFLNLAPSTESLVQRYIMLLERLRNFRK